MIGEWNREAERLFGFPAEEAVGRRAADVIILPDDREGHEERLVQAFRSRPTTRRCEASARSCERAATASRWR